MPKLKDAIFAVPEGEIYPKWFLAGEEVSGSVAKAAEDQDKLDKRGRKAVSPPENK